MELFIINVDGSKIRQITNLGGSNWAPFYLNDNRRIVFSSNFNATRGNFGAFDLYLIVEDGSNLKRVFFFKFYLRTRHLFNSFRLLIINFFLLSLMVYYFLSVYLFFLIKY